MTVDPGKPRLPTRWASLLLALMLGLGGGLFSFPSPLWGALAEGDKALPFKADGLLGEKLDTGPLLGKQVVVLKFGSIYCSTCVQSIGAFSDLQKKYPENELKVMEVNLDIFGTFRVKKFYQGLQGIIHFPVFIDKDLSVSNSYGVTSLPAVAIIGKDGKVVRLFKGYQESELDGILGIADDLVAGREPGKVLATGDKDAPFSILFPTNFTKTQSEELHVIGRLNAENGNATLTLNGGSTRQGMAQKGYYFLRTPISLGSNYIEVTGRGDKGVVGTKAVVLFREPKLGKGLDVAFPLYRFHAKDNEKACLKCHEMTPPEGAAQDFQAVTKMCGACHNDLARDTFIHGPITVGGCSPCHDFASQPRYTLLSQGADLCYSCHQEKQEEYARTYIHGPLAAGVCHVCHSPHGSNEKYQLRLPQGQMCMVCHQQIKEESLREVKHKPFDKGECSSCHDPHSSNNPKYFLKRAGDDLCYGCHQDSQMAGHKHPVGVVPVSAYPGIKLNEKGELTCLSCHHPHSSETKKLLPLKGCPTCHSY